MDPERRNSTATAPGPTGPGGSDHARRAGERLAACQGALRRIGGAASAGPGGTRPHRRRSWAEVRGSMPSTARHPATGTTTTATRALRRRGRRCAARSSKRSGSPTPANFEAVDDLRPIRSAAALRTKALYLYFPDELLPITSSAHLAHFIALLGGSAGNAARSRPIAPCCSCSASDRSSRDGCPTRWRPSSTNGPTPAQGSPRGQDCSWRARRVLG